MGISKDNETFEAYWSPSITMFEEFVQVVEQ
jgi:hypothetical protein